MVQVDVAIVGGGLGGSVAAAMLGRAGISAALVDPHPVYPPDFRCEKFDSSQLALLRRTGLADLILPAGTPNDEVWVARFGRRLERRRMEQCGIRYEVLVNAARGAIPATTQLIVDKAARIDTSADQQVVALAGGRDISARLVVLANGLNSALRQNLGMGRKELSACHSISIGFDVTPQGPAGFDFKALTLFALRRAARVAYVTFFPVDGAMRANLFVYRDMRDPWLRTMRHQPLEALAEILPELQRQVGLFSISSPVTIRPVDLYATTGVERDGIVLVGDAFATSCPAAGTGTNKVLTDVERLCAHYIPEWLATPGMGQAKIAAFYRDPAKLAADAHSLAKAYHLKSLSIDPGLAWNARRVVRSAAQIGRAVYHRGRDWLTPVPLLSSRNS